MFYSVIYPNWAFIIVSIILGIITLITAAGNILVFAALFRFKGLRSTSNLLIGNLALSDFLLAITVLPFSATTDSTGLWLFGSLLCDIWLVIDVLYCTASVWSLVVIAFDRFTATTFPVWYRGQQTKVRVFCYIIVVWILSGLICMPGLLGWGYKHMDMGSNSNQSLPPSTSTHVYNVEYQGYECVLFTEADYIVYSAMGSFIIPLFIMIGLYAKIFVVLKARSRLHNKSTQRRLAYAKSQNSQNEESSLDLTEERRSWTNKTSETTIDQTNQEVGISNYGVRLLNQCLDCIRCQTLSNQQTTNNPDSGRTKLHKKRIHLSDLSSSSMSHLNNETEPRGSVYELEPNQPNGVTESSKLIEMTCSNQTSKPSTDASTPIWIFTKTNTSDLDQSKHIESTGPNGLSSSASNQNTISPSIPDTDSGVTNCSTMDTRIKKSITPTIVPVVKGAAAACRKQSRAAERADQRERRATKRMALIILIFVICWIPFTLMYLIRGLCGETECPDIPDLRKFVTWLGYVNSTINPVLYAMFNKEFRHAFAFLLGCRKRKVKR